MHGLQCTQTAIGGGRLPPTPTMMRRAPRSIAWLISSPVPAVVAATASLCLGTRPRARARTLAPSRSRRSEPSRSATQPRPGAPNGPVTVVTSGSAPPRASSVPSPPSASGWVMTSWPAAEQRPRAMASAISARGGRPLELVGRDQDPHGGWSADQSGREPQPETRSGPMHHQHVRLQRDSSTGADRRAAALRPRGVRSAISAIWMSIELVPRRVVDDGLYRRSNACGGVGGLRCVL